MRKSIVALTAALLLGFHASPISASPLTMSFDSGTLFYWSPVNEPDRVFRQVPFGSISYFDPLINDTKIVGYEQNGMYLDIDSDYEVYFGSGIGPHSWGKFYPTPPFNSVTFSLTSGGRFNLDSIFLVIASTVSRREIGCSECWGGAEYKLVASNGAEFLFPTSYDYQNELLTFGEHFRGITSFSLFARAGPDDPIFGINSISVTPVPAPATLTLLGLGLIGLGYARAAANGRLNITSEPKTIGELRDL